MDLNVSVLDKLTVLTYNFYCRPHFMFKDNQGVRAKLLAYKIKEYETTNNIRIDVILLQEIFNNFLSDKVYKIINKEMSKIGFIFHSKRPESTYLPCNGGCYVLSRHIITDCSTKTFNFTKASPYNFMAAKGISYAKIKYLNKDFHIISTHLDSFEEKYRKKQMYSIKKWLKARKITDNIIIGGDYNIDFYGEEMDNVDEVYPEEEGYEMPDLIYTEGTFDQYSINGNTNDFVKRRGSESGRAEKSYLDFFVYKSSEVERADMKAIELKHEQKANDIIFSTEFFANIYTDKKTINIKDLSDHYGVLSNFYFKNKIST